MTDRFINGRAQRQVKNLRVGDLVDLQNDEFADPIGFLHPESPSDACQDNGWEYAFAEVREIEQETTNCVVVAFDNFTCGFPPDHWVDVAGGQIR